MLRSMDRFMTGLLLTAAGSFLLLCVTTFFLEVGWVEMRFRKGWHLRWHWQAWSGYRRHAEIQGNRLVFPRGVSEFSAPVIRPDGRLDRRHVLRWDPDRENFSEAHLIGFDGPYPFTPRDVSLEARRSTDYRTARSRMVTRRWFGHSYWACSPDLGIVRINREGRFEGSLTDEGWVPGRLARSTFNQALFWASEQMRWRKYDFGVNLSLERALVYSTSEGLYVADLHESRIRRVASLEGPSFKYLVDDTEGRESLYVFQSGRIFQISLIDATLVRALEQPASFREREDPEIAIGSDDKLIFRWKLKQGFGPDASRYRVAVVDSTGALEMEYTYDFSVEDALPEASLIRPSYPKGIHGDEVLETTAGGRLCSAFAPPAWQAVRSLASSEFHTAVERTVELDFFGYMVDGPPWISLLVSGLLAIPLALRARRHSRGILAPVLWFVSVLALGIPAIVTYAFLGRTAPLVACPACGRTRSARFVTCPSCGGASARPERLGIEIVRPFRTEASNREQ